MEETKGTVESKTVWTGLIAIIISLLTNFDVIPPEAKEMVTEAALAVFGGAVIIWRVFFTNAKIPGLFGGG